MGPKVQFDTWPRTEIPVHLIASIHFHFLESGPCSISSEKHITRIGSNGVSLIVWVSPTFYNCFHDPEDDAREAPLCSVTSTSRLTMPVAATYGWTDLDLGHSFHETKQGIRFSISESAPPGSPRPPPEAQLRTVRRGSQAGPPRQEGQGETRSEWPGSKVQGVHEHADLSATKKKTPTRRRTQAKT